MPVYHAAEQWLLPDFVTAHTCQVFDASAA